jgi:hypothetical protein
MADESSASAPKVRDSTVFATRVVVEASMEEGVLPADSSSSSPPAPPAPVHARLFFMFRRLALGGDGVENSAGRPVRRVRMPFLKLVAE